MTMKLIFTKMPNTSIVETNAGGIIFEIEFSFEPARDVNDLNFKLGDVSCIEMRNFPYNIETVVLDHESSTDLYWKGLGKNVETTHGHFTKSIKIESSISSGAKDPESNRGLNRRCFALEGNVCAEGYDFQFYCYNGRVSCEMIPTKNFVDSENPENFGIWQLQGRPKSLLKRFGPQELE